jgi:multicomponent Na+:H+ antiporter subunit D
VVTAFVAATATKVSVYVLVRYYFTVFGGRLELGEVPFDRVLLVLSLIAIFSMSLVALFQQDLKRMFAYSSVAQVGYITLGIALGNAAGLTGALSHLFNHGVTKGAIFLLVGGMALRAGSTRFRDVAGLARRMPLTSFGLVLAGLSLVGIPGTAGFVTKWYLIRASLDHGSWWLAALIVASSLIALGYVWRFVEGAYLQPAAAAGAAPAAAEAPLSMLLPAWVLVAACIYFGFDTSFNLGYAQQAVGGLLPGAR